MGYTLNTIDKHAAVYAIDSQSSNSWKSSNPHSGIHETDKARCLDTSIDPTCNQGGVLVVSADCRNGTIDAEKTCTLQAKANGGRSLNCMPVLIYDMRGNGEGGGYHPL